MKNPWFIFYFKRLSCIQFLTDKKSTSFLEYLFFFGIAIIYACYAVIASKEDLFGDEWRYLYYADNLIKGYYSPNDRIFLWNGPLYPLFLVPFRMLELSKSYAVAANGIFYAAALMLLYKVLMSRCQLLQARIAIFYLASYLPIISYFKYLYTEAITFFLISAWIYCFSKACERQGFKWWLMASLALSLVALCKVLYGYVILGVMLVACVPICLRRGQRIWSGVFYHSLFALILCSPYLIYTYTLTAKIFYWGSPGASALYWMSSPFPEEKGEWFHQGHVYENPVLREHHKELYDKLTGLDVNPDLSVMEQVFNLSTPEAAEVFSSRAVEQIKNYPFKYLQNWLANVGRLSIDWPYSFKSTLNFKNRYLLFNTWLIFLVGIVVLGRIRGKFYFSQESLVLWTVFILAFLGSSLVSGMGRLMIPNIPILIVASLCSFKSTRNPMLMD